MKQMPKNPKAPKPEFVTAEFERFTAFGFKCVKHGVIAFGNTEKEAVSLWFEAYKSEYGV